MSVAVKAPNSVTTNDFLPLVRACMDHLQETGPNGMYTTNQLQAVATTVCPSLDWDSYGERSVARGKCSAGKWMFSFTMTRLVKLGEWSYRDKDLYGIQEASTTSSAPATQPGETVFEDPFVYPEASPPQPLVAVSALAASQNIGVSWFPESYSFPEDEPFGGDVYLSRVAAHQTPCFSGWSPEHTACKGCSLASKCFKASLSSFAEIGRILAEKDKAAANPAPVSPAAQQVVAPPEPKEIPGSRFASLPLDTVCTSCSKVIKAGTRARSLPGFGVFHVECEVKK